MPSGVRGAFDMRSGFPSAVRGIPDVFGDGHWAANNPAVMRNAAVVRQSRMGVGRGASALWLRDYRQAKGLIKIQKATHTQPGPFDNVLDVPA